MLEAILKSTKLPELVCELNAALDSESKARKQFLRELTPEVKAEFILGEVLMHSPAKARHLDVTLDLAFALKSYLVAGGAGKMFVEKCLISLTRNDFEPDIVWFNDEKAAKFTTDQMRFPAPDFVVEVLSASTESKVRGVKFEDYALHGVSEYWIVDPEAQTLEQYLLREGEECYHLHEKLAHGTAKAAVISDFEIPLAELFKKST